MKGSSPSSAVPRSWAGQIRVEDRVVLGEKMVELRLRILPVLPPPVGLSDVLGPLHRRGDVADAGVEPHVEALVLEARFGDGDAPLDVPRYGPLLETPVDNAEDEILDRGAPVLLSGDVFPQPLGELGEVEVEVRRLPDLHRPARDLGVGFYQLVRLVPRAAIVALVSPRLLVAAHRTGPLHIAVGQEAALRRTVHLLGLRLRDVAALLELAVEELGVLRVKRRRSARKVIEGDAETLEGLLHVGPPVVDDLLRVLPLALRRQRDRHAVLVGATGVDYILPTSAQITHERVGRQVCTRDLPHVQRPVGIRQRRSYEIPFSLLTHEQRIAAEGFRYQVSGLSGSGGALLRCSHVQNNPYLKPVA